MTITVRTGHAADTSTESPAPTGGSGVVGQVTVFTRPVPSAAGYAARDMRWTASPIKMAAPGLDHIAFGELLTDPEMRDEWLLPY